MKYPFLFLGAFLILIQTGICQIDTTQNTLSQFNSAHYDSSQQIDSPNDFSPYKLKPAIDIPLTVVGAGLSGYGFYLISEKPSVSEAKVYSLDPRDINSFDRGATDQFSTRANKNSDYFMYGAIPIPFIVSLIDDDMRKDFFKISFLFVEAMAITGTAYGMTAGNIDRYRPLVYNPNAPMKERKRGYAKSSFIGGHPAVTATAGFFIAKVYSDYHPESNFKYVLYGLAATATAGNAILRYQAGKHFPSDLLTGVAFGTLTGILVPHFHKKERKSNFSFMPFSGDVHGLSMTYKFD